MKQSIAILDFGTSKITALIGSRGINGSICIDGIGVCEYAGFSRGEWLDPERLQSSIVQAIAGAENSARVHVDKLYIGVPNEFSMCKLCNLSISLNKKRKLIEQDVNVLRDSGNKFGEYPDWTVINIQPVYYTLDDERKLIEPVGMVSTRLGGCISYILARNDFISVVDAAVNSADIAETEYVSSSLAEMLFLFDDYRRDNCVMLADIGALGTSFVIGRGDGICKQYYFPWGGARITAALVDELNVSRKEAERIKRKTVLSLNPNYVSPPRRVLVTLSDGSKEEREQPEDESEMVKQSLYEVEVDNEIKSYDVEKINNIVRVEIELLAKYIAKALKNCDYDYPEYTPLSITGGGLNHIRGGAEYLSECLNREVETVKPSLPMLDRPQLSSALGLMDMILTVAPPSVGILNKIRRRFGKR